MDEDIGFPKPKAAKKRRRYLRSTSEKRRQRLALYRLVKRAYRAGLAAGQGREKPYCERCEENPSTVLHHKAGRRGMALVDPKGFADLCEPCHRYIHSNDAEAREEGWLLSRN